MDWDKIGEVTLLVAEDDMFNRKLISTMLLKHSNIKVIEAIDGEEALTLLDTHKVDALLLDIHMPNMNGFETLQHIREGEENSDLPIIMITSDDVEKSHSFSLGADAFLPKPFKLEDLEEEVYGLLDKR
jgi:CheY-like chemotaxis protein